MATIELETQQDVEPRTPRRANRAPNVPLRTALLAGLLITAVGIAYAPSLTNGYIWDDDYYLTRNALVVHPHGLTRIWLIPRMSPQYYPVVFTSFWLEYRLWGLDPAGYHAVNIALHIGSALLFWRLLSRLRAPGAYAAALLFAMHPVHVETVAWITERKNTLSLFLGLLSLLFLLRPLGLDAFETTPTDTARRRRRYAAALLCFVLALFSKSVACVVPAAACLLLCWKGRLSLRNTVLLVPLFAIGIVAGLNTAWLERSHVGATGVDFDLSASQRTILAGVNVWFYAGKLLYPWPLTFIYPRWNPAELHGAAWLYPLTAAALPPAFWLGRNRFGRGPLIAVLYFGGALVPAIGFFNVYPFRFSFVADHFQYHASLGLFALAGAALATVAAWRPKSNRAYFAASQPSAWIVVFLVLSVVGYGAIVRARLPVYRDAETLWADTLRQNPQAWIAHSNLGMEYLQRNDTDRAAEHFLAALALKSDYGPLHNNLGMTLVSQGNLAGAAESFRRAVELSPQYTNHHENLADAYASLHRYDDAANTYRIVAHRSAANPVVRQRLAWILAVHTPERLLQPREAIEFALEADRLTGGREALVLDTLAAAYAQAGDFVEARRRAGEALQLAEQAGNKPLAAEIQARKKLYESNRAFRGEAPTP